MAFTFNESVGCTLRIFFRKGADQLALAEEKAANIMKQHPNIILIPGISPKITAAKTIPYTGSRQVVTLTVDAVIPLRDETKRV